MTSIRDRIAAELFERVAGPEGPHRAARLHDAEGARWFAADRPIRQVHGDAAMFVGGLRALLQPVYRISGDDRAVHAVECLARGPSGSNGESASVLFDYVRRKREEPRVDRACVAAALSAVHEVAEEVRICVNVHASTLARDERSSGCTFCRRSGTGRFVPDAVPRDQTPHDGAEGPSQHQRR